MRVIMAALLFTLVAAGVSRGERREASPRPVPVGTDLNLEPDSLVSPDPSDPGSAVWSLFASFAAASVDGYVASMAEGYRFESDDPDFRARYPHGMNRDDERRFATALFRPSGAALPVAIAVELQIGPVEVSRVKGRNDRATAVAEWIHTELEFADGTRAELVAGRAEFELVRDSERWQVLRWREVLAAPGARPRVEPAPLAHDTTADAGAAEVPGRLALARRAGPEDGTLQFALTLPVRAPVSLEIYDIQGRHVVRNDLGSLPAGHHAVTMAGSAIPPGVYWARVRQAQQAATARVVWMR